MKKTIKPTTTENNYLNCFSSMNISKKIAKTAVKSLRPKETLKEGLTYIQTKGLKTNTPSSRNVKVSEGSNK
jgi:hypothetical protein